VRVRGRGDREPTRSSLIHALRHPAAAVGTLRFMRRKEGRKRRRLWLLGIASVVAEPVAMKLRGYPIGGKLVVRCRKGHLFTTFWLPGVSLKAVRLGWWRYQRCPVGGHWSLITPVRPSELTDSERQEARSRSDIPLP
jgi:hypothetical protein